ncbi:MAG TPA: glycosyltransferase family 2 protein [Acidimicrobiales bacterium]|nr:glycosyltransferase family 2 protein [Acidimicrobiales bacterium]
MTESCAPRVSVVIPAHDEGEGIVACLDRVFEAVALPCEILVVFDALDDTTIPYLEKYAASEPRLVPTLNTYGRGPADALRFGVDQARAPVVVVTMADGCDDPQQIDALARLVERGVVVAAASRYSRGGQQVGVPTLKRAMSKSAGLTLHWFARVGTHDATNSFKAYSKAFVQEVGIQSDAGFEMGIELVAKARRLRRPVAELPTIWLDRTAGVSSFKTAAWLSRYLRWYVLAFGPKLTVEELRRRTGRTMQ